MNEITYNDYIKKLKVKELEKILNTYNKLAVLYDFDLLRVTKKKTELLSILDNTVLNNYIKYFILTLSLKDFEVLKHITCKKTIDFLNDNSKLINYLIDNFIVFKDKDLVIPNEIKNIIKKDIKKKELQIINNNTKIKNIVEGIIIAYGLVDKSFFESILVSQISIEKLYILLDFSYDLDYTIDDEKVISTKLNSKKRINKYLKNKKYKEFSIDDFILMQENKYHYSIKSYKDLIHMLKKNYIFKRSDIIFIDKNIVIPYLYNSLNEEEKALNELQKRVLELFEFNGDYLKNNIIEETKEIRNHFPLWEYRGYTKEEKNEA